MAMPKMGMMTFLKGLLGKSTMEKVRDYGRYLEPGGYDFYRGLKEAIKDYVYQNKKLSAVEESINKAKNPVERKHNLEAFRSFVVWVEKNGGEFIAPPKGIYKSPNEIFSIKIEPELAVKNDGIISVFTFWTIKKPLLTKIVAGVGIYLMESALKKGAFKEANFYIVKIDTGKLYDYTSKPNNPSILLNAEVAQIESILGQDQE